MPVRKITRAIRRPGGKPTVPLDAPPKEHASLVDFLAALQTYELSLLPVQQQAGLEVIGRGLSGAVYQATADAATALAFKQGIPSRLPHDDEENREWSSLVAEVSVLQHPPIRRHAHIANILGVSFSIDSANQAWPLLVTRKAVLGDLAMVLHGKDRDELNEEQRSQLVKGVVDAVYQLHSCGVTHGDIKPGNILVEGNGQDMNGLLTDFGSCVVGGQQRVPTVSLPWNAPELRCGQGLAQKLGFEQLAQADLFSLGLVCFHILIPLQYLHENGLSFLRRWDQSDKAWETVTSKLEAEKSDPASFGSKMLTLIETAGRISEEGKALLRVIVNGTIIPPCNERKMPWQEVLGVVLSNDGSPAPPPIYERSASGSHETHIAFNAGKMLGELDDTDYVVRANIARDLESKAKTSCCLECRRGYGLQVALCREIGFGCQRSKQEKDSWLSACGETQDTLDKIVGDIGKNYEGRGRVSADVLKELGIGILQTTDRVQHYRAGRRLSDAETSLRQELAARREAFGPSHRSLIRLGGELVRILRRQARNREACDLQKEIISITEMAYGLDSSPCAMAKLELARIWTDLGLLVKVDEVQAEQLEVLKRIIGHQHPDYLVGKIGQVNAKILRNEYPEAVALLQEVIASRAEALGPDHPLTIETELDLGGLLVEAGRRIQASELLTSIEARIRSTLQGNLWHGSNLFLRQAQALAEIGEFDLATQKVDAAFAVLGRMRLDENDEQFVGAHEIRAEVHRLRGDFLAEETCLRGVLQRIEADSRRSRFFSMRLAQNLEGQGRAEDAKVIAEAAVNSLGPSAVSAEPFLYLAFIRIHSAVHEGGNPETAEKMLADALELCMRHLGHGHQATARAAHMLGGHFVEQRRFVEAETWLKPLVASAAQDPGISTVAIAQQLAISYRERGLFAEAEELCVRATGWAASLSGASHPSVQSVQNILGSVYVRWERLSEADDVLQKVYAVCHAPELKSSVAKNLAKLRSAQGREEEAVELERESHTLSPAASGLGSPRSLVAEANLLRHRLPVEGLHPALEQEILENLGRRADMFGEAHPGRLGMMADLAYWYGRSGRPDDANRLFLEVEQLGGLGEEDNPLEHATHLGKLAESLLLQRRHADAEPLERKALDIRRRVYGDAHETVLKTEARLATTLTELGRYADAEELLRHALGCWEARAGIDNSADARGDPRATSMLAHYSVKARIDLAGVLYFQRKLDESLRLFREALELEESTNARRAVVAELSDSIRVVEQQMAGPSTVSA